MPVNVDYFFEFVAEELSKDHGSSLTVYAPSGDSQVWTVSCSLGEGLGNDLTAALNRLSQKLDFTSKDIPHEDEPSLVKRVAELVLERGSALTVMCADRDPGWRAGAGPDEDIRTTSGHTMNECLLAMMNDILGGAE